MSKTYILSLFIAAVVLVSSTAAFIPTQQKSTIQRHVSTLPDFTASPTNNIAPTPQHHKPPFVSVSLSMNNPLSNNGGGVGGGSGLDMDPGLKLLICILIDFIGVASFAAPGIGEAADVGWAPISALLINYLFGNGIITAVALFEELSPGLDVIPTATIAWFIENAGREDSVATPPPPPPPPASKEEQFSSSVPPPPASSSVGGKRPDVSNAIDVDILD